jgi:hypothetical protein
MADVRFIRKDGQSVDTAIVRKQFFESAIAAKPALSASAEFGTLQSLAIRLHAR